MISRWRVQAARIQITSNGWRADRMGFSNDPFTPAQTRVDAEDVVTREQPNGDLLISARRNRLIVEERLPVPVSRRQLIQKEEEVENRWVFGVDNDDRDGGSDIAPGDLFGLEAKLIGRYDGTKVRADADISSFSGDDFLDNSRYWGSIERSFELGALGEVTTNLFGTYRYRTWNGSLGETDIQAAYGVYGEKKGEFEQGKTQHRYLFRGAMGDYYAERFDSNRKLRSGRGSLFASVTSTIPIWRGSTAELTPLAAAATSALTSTFGTARPTSNA